MCGIVGSIGDRSPERLTRVERMNQAQTHRGPDDAGYYEHDEPTPLCFGFRRLAILDLSEDGHQPMIDPESGNVLVFNGELYNYVELRTQLVDLGHRFRSQSDSEVVLRALSQWSLGALEKFRGMYGFAFYEKRSQRTFLVRDRMGIKPLYTAQTPDGVLLFSSELRALLASRALPRTLNRTALESYLWHGFVVGPETMVENVRLLEPGHVLETGPHQAPRSWSYYTHFGAFPKTRTTDLQHELHASAKLHLQSDVPLGVFLSGGIDSSAVAALARRNDAEVQTFNIAFDEAAYDESKYAAEVARALGTTHHEIKLTERDFHTHLDQALGALDQPTFDGLNSFFVSRAVKDAGITVALAGTGGDELFGGYKSFVDIPKMVRALGRTPSTPRRWLGQAFQTVMNTHAQQRRDGVPSQVRFGKLTDVLAYGQSTLGAYQVAYALYTSAFQTQLLGHPPAHTSLGLPKQTFARWLSATQADGPVEGYVSQLEMASFLGERLLRDTDAASMAVSLEARVPFLDHRLIETVLGLPFSERFEPLGKKRALIRTAMPNLPVSMFERKKAGFVLPIEVWARTRLKDEIESTLSDAPLCARIGLDAGVVRRFYTAFQKGHSGLYWSRLWALFVLLRWCREHDVQA